MIAAGFFCLMTMIFCVVPNLSNGQRIIVSGISLLLEAVFARL